MQEQIAREKTDKARNIGLAVTLGCCLIWTIGTLMLFSQPGFHENTDNMFRQLISIFVGLWNTPPWGIFILIGGLVVPLLGLLALSPLDRLTRKIPSGSFLLDHVGLSFERSPGLRFLPAFVTIAYFIIGSFMRGTDSSTDFDPDSYNPFAYQYSAGEWVNWCFMVLAVFAVFLVVAEGIVNAGWVGMVIHIPLVLAANIVLVALMTGIMFVAVTLLGFIGQILMILIALLVFIPGMLFMSVIQRKK